MTKFKVPFTSNDGLQHSQLTYQLHDHELALMWKKLVIKSQNILDASYENNSQLYGKYFNKKEDVSLRIHYGVLVLKEAFKEEWEDALFDPIRDNYFLINQKALNLAHTFFERAHARMTRDSRFKTYFEDLSDLNHNIHRYENILGGPEGFSLSAHLNEGVKGTIDPGLNKLFTLEPLWGEMCLGYCHVGEGYYECFLNDYPTPPTPQTHIAGDFVLNFHHPVKINTEPLQAWINKLFGKEVSLRDLPIGMVPIAKIADDYNEKTIIEFFKVYPLIGKTITFL